MMKKVGRRSFLKALGFAGTVCAVTALTGCAEGGTGDGSVPLSNLTPLNGNIPWNKGVQPEDPFGNIYVRGVNYTVFLDMSNWRIMQSSWPNLSASVEYPVGQQYRKLTMKLNPYKDMASSSWALVKVYADDVLVGISGTIKQKTDEPVEFEVDITGAKYIRIEPYVKESCYYLGGVMYTTGGLILWDVKLWK